MTPRQFVKDEIQHIREMTNELSDAEYAWCLEELIIGLEDMLERCNWKVPEEE